MLVYQGEPLNILHTVGMKEMYPIIRVHFKILGNFSMNQFKKAVQSVHSVVPELFCKYRLADNTFVPVDDDQNHVVFPNINPDQDIGNWDLFKDPQWRIYLNHESNGYDVTIFLSHILTDGAGTKQLLTLLAKAYNTGNLDGVHNHTDIDWLRDLLKKHPVAVDRKVDHPSQPLSLPSLVESKAPQRRTGKVYLDQKMTQLLIKASHQEKVTLNDLFMAAFGQVVQRFCSTDRIALACPTDMRQFIPGKFQWRVANHTSRYNINVASDLDQSFEQTVQNVHQAMETNKQSFQCLSSVKTLVENYQKGDLKQLQQITEDNYHVRPISYTNFGIIDSQRLKFVGCQVTDFDMLGSYRQMPMFQVAVSTFKQQIILAYAMIGTDEEYYLGNAVTRTMADLLEKNALKYGV